MGRKVKLSKNAQQTPAARKNFLISSLVHQKAARENCLSFLMLCLTLPIFYLFLSSSILGAPLKGQKTKLNVLLITIDTLRTDRVSFYSPKHLKTSHLDSLAQKSIVFTRAFAHTTTTLPSHTNILLGTTPSYHGVHDNANFVVRQEFLTMAEHLKTYGYATGGFVGGFPLESRFGLDQGFDLYDDRFDRSEAIPGGGGERLAQAVLDSALTW